MGISREPATIAATTANNFNEQTFMVLLFLWGLETTKDPFRRSEHKIAFSKRRVADAAKGVLLNGKADEATEDGLRRIVDAMHANLQQQVRPHGGCLNSATIRQAERRNVVRVAGFETPTQSKRGAHDVALCRRIGSRPS